MCPWNYWNGRHPSRADWHETSRLDEPRHGHRSSSRRPSPPFRCWMAPTGREAGYSLGFDTGGKTLETPPLIPIPRRLWNRAVAWFQPPEEARRPSAPRHRGSVARRVPPLSERRHRTRPKTPAPSASPRSRPQPRNFLRHPATWLTLEHTYPYICRSQQLGQQPERMFLLAPTTSLDNYRVVSSTRFSRLPSSVISLFLGI